MNIRLFSYLVHKKTSFFHNSHTPMIIYFLFFFLSSNIFYFLSYYADFWNISNSIIYNNYIKYGKNKCLCTKRKNSILKTMIYSLLGELGAPPPNVCFATKGRLRHITKKENVVRSLLHFGTSPNLFM